MSILASNQITLVEVEDATDGYSVFLTSEAYTFIGNTTGAPSGLSCTTQVLAYYGAQQYPKVNISSITSPDGILATISNNDTATPTITFTTTTTITEACEATIPVVVGGVTINKKFSFAVAKQGTQGDTGKGISSVTPQYYISTSKTSATGGSWSDTAPTTIEKGTYLWTRMKVIYTNPSTTEYTTATYDSMTDSRIEQLKDSITLSVTDGLVGNTAKIKLSIDDETREASIDLTGAVTFSDLSTAGNTIINGSNITTGTVSAERINVEDLMAQHLTSTGGLSVTGDFELQNGWGSISKYSDSEYDGWLQISASGTTGLGQQVGLIRLRQGYVYIDTTGQGAIGSAGIKVGGGSVGINANKVVDIEAPTVEIGNTMSDSITGGVTIHEPVKIYKNSSSIVSLSDYILSVVDGTWEESY